MSPRSRRAANIRFLGNAALTVGFLIAIISMSAHSNDLAAYVLAGLLVILGAGLRIEAAVVEVRQE